MPDVLDRLRAAKPETPAPPIEPLWRRLDHEPPVQAPALLRARRPARARWARGLTGILAISTVAVFVLAGLLLVTLGRGGARRSVAAGSTGSSAPPGVGSATARRARRRTAAVSQARADRAAPVLLENFDVFADNAAPVSGAGAEAGLEVSRPAVSALPFGVVGSNLPGRPDYREVRQVSTRDGFVFFVIPGVSDACVTAYYRAPGQSLTSESAGGACAANLAQVEQTGMWQVFRMPDGERLLYGFVPRSNRSITMTLANRATRIVPVLDGVFVTPAAGVISLQTRSISGQSTTSLGPDAR